MRSAGQHSKLTDEELLHAYCSSNNNELLGHLLQRYTMLLFGVGMKYLKDKEQALDAVQQVFLKVLTHTHIAEVRNFKAWLYILMRNHCLQLLRDTSYRLNDDVLVNVAETTGDIAEGPIWPEPAREQLEAALQDLAEEQRTCISKFYLQNKSYKQIMEQTGFSFEQVKSYIQNGKRNLKAILLKKTSRY